MTFAVLRLEESRLLNYLPDIYRGGEFICRFLHIFEATWEPLEQQINHMYAYFDPHLSPAAFLPWLSTWVGLVFNENIPEERQRELLSKAVWLFEWRGTEKALREHLRICLDVNPEAIVIQHQGNDIPPHQFRVSITMPNASLNVDDLALKELEERVNRIIQAEKPAHTNYTVEIQSTSI